MIYRGKVDWWLGLILIGVFFVLTVHPFLTHHYWRLLIPAAYVAFIFGCVYPQYYETAEQALTIRAGLRTFRIPYADIRAVEPTHNPISSLGMSLDRVRIEYSQSSVMIAPERKQEFLRDLGSKAKLPEKIF